MTLGSNNFPTFTAHIYLLFPLTPIFLYCDFVTSFRLLGNSILNNIQMFDLCYNFKLKIKTICIPDLTKTPLIKHTPNLLLDQYFSENLYSIDKLLKNLSGVHFVNFCTSLGFKYSKFKIRVQMKNSCNRYWGRNLHFN